jgi:PAS domain S-box-containing protein
MDSAEVRAPMLAQLWQVIAVIGAMLFGAAAGVGLVWRQQRVRFYRQEAESMAALRLMRFSVERASDALFWMTADARIVDVNTAACRSLGYTREEMLQLRAPDVDIHYSAEKWPQLFAELRQRGSMTFESEQRTKDGRLFPVETVANYVTQDNEEYNCVFVRDITERKKAVDALREAEWKFQALFEKGPIGVAYHKMIYDASGKPIDYLFLDANDACLKLTGVDPRGKTVTEAFPGIENDPFDYIGKYGRVARTGEELRFESYLQVNGQWYDVVCYQYKPDHFVAAFVNITTRKQAEEALRQSEFRWKFAVDGSGDGLWDWDVLSGTVFFSRRWKEMLGFAEEEIGSGRDEWSKRVHPDDRTRVMAEVQAHLAGTTPHYISEHRVSCKDGAWKWMLDRGVVLSRDADGKPLRVIGTQSDITERRLAVEKHDKLQSLLIQAQKMESVGRLAGGIAHDFNNLLMGIMNYVDLCRDALEADHPTRGYLDEITVNAERSANLTRQLLAFARKQTIAPTVLDLNDAVVGMLKMLEQLLGENVSMTWVPGARLWQVKVDPSQVDQIMANLCVNARDAIAGVGRLIIETSNVVADERYCAGNAGAVPGEYVQLAVSDTGHGMGKDVLEHIFEPFFTTKEVGKGTGLGLATVYGIAVQNKGFITVYSEPGKGTTFKIHFPRSEAPSAAAPVAAAPSVLPRGSETILLVEDEKSVRVTTHMFLEELGYKVLVADDPGKALGLAAQYSGDIDLLITDVIMPNMSGRHLADQLCLTRPSTRRLFMSGFTADVIAREGVLEDGVQFLTKPFGRETLARKVREVLECGDEERSM